MKRYGIGLAASAWVWSLAANAADWVLDPANSEIRFEAIGMGNKIGGSFEEFTTEITFDPDALDSASVITRIDLESVEIGIKDGAQQLRGADWLDTDNHPTATFTSSSFEAKGDNNYDVAGELELKGVVEPVVLPMSITIEGDRAGAVGELTIDRHVFNIGEGQWSSGDTVGSEVVLLLSIEASLQ